MNILCFGAGAIGTYIGGSLSFHGHRVVFLENPAVGGELKRSGLIIHLLKDTIIVSGPTVVSNIIQALDLGPYDVGIFALKSFDTQEALAGLKPHREAVPPILCLQNGVDNEKSLKLVLGQDKVIAGTVTSAIAKTAIGAIRLERLRGVGIASGHPLSTELVKVFNLAGLRATPHASTRSSASSPKSTDQGE